MARMLQQPPAHEDAAVRNHLESLSKSELLQILLEARNAIPELRQQLADRMALRDGHTAKLIAAARREIQQAAREPGWTNHWSGEGSIPDYSRVRQRLETLLAAGQADEVVALGAYLLERGIRQIEISNDEGETGMEIGACMAVVFKAVMQSKLSVAQRLLWEINARLQDVYGILDGLKGPVDAEESCGKEDWDLVAATLAERLARMPVRDPNSDNFSAKYDREQVMRWLLRALNQAGRGHEVIPILERETAHTQCYTELVQHLIAANLADKARAWARKGFAQTVEKLPGIAWQLEAQLRELAAREKNAPLVAAYRAMEFFAQPGAQAYSELEKAAQTVGLWAEIKKPVMTFLETGRRPDRPNPTSAGATQRQGKIPGKTTADDQAPACWPLPAPELPEPKNAARWNHFPDTSTLMAIAIKDRRHDDALRWYRQGLKPGVYGADHEGAEVAQAVCSTHPDAAIAIWKDLVAKETAHVKPSAYQTAGGYLREIRRVYERIDRMAEWNAYLSGLRMQNKRRPRMLEVLDALEGRRTRIVP